MKGLTFQCDNSLFCLAISSVREHEKLKILLRISFLACHLLFLESLPERVVESSLHVAQARASAGGDLECLEKYMLQVVEGEHWLVLLVVSESFCPTSVCGKSTS